MLKSTNKVFSSSNFPIIVVKANKGATKVRSYFCKDSSTVILSNYSNPMPVSPISGGKLVPNNSDRFIRTISNEDFEELEKVCTCPKCQATLYSSKSINKALSSIHCINCGEEINIKEPSDYYNKLGDYIDETVEDISSEDSAKDKVEEVVVDNKESNTMVENQVDAENDVKSDVVEDLINDIIDEVNNTDDCGNCDQQVIVEVEAPVEDATSNEIIEDLVNEALEDGDVVVDGIIVVDMLSTVSKFENFNIIKSGHDTFHYVMQNKKLIAELHKSRSIPSVAKMFDDLPMLERAFNETIAETKGFTQEIKSSFGIVPTLVKVNSQEIISNTISKKLEEIQTDADNRIKDFEESYEQSIGIAGAGINKDVFDNNENVLADNLIKVFESLGIENADEIVYSTFNKYGNDYLRKIITKAKELKSLSLEERNKIASKVMEFNTSLSKKVSLSNILESKKEADNKTKEDFDLKELNKKLFG